MEQAGQRMRFRVDLAPMAGFTDAFFRRICYEQGADEATTELISAKGFLYQNQKTRELLPSLPGEGPLAAQLFGREPTVMAEAARRIEAEFAGSIGRIDLNMGCPVQKVVNHGEGSALMKEPVLAGRITEAVVRYVRLPVSVKFRKGWDEEHANAVEFAHILEQSGAALLTVHGRTRNQMYAGKADWDVIARVKERVSIPVLGNGDVDSPASALRMRSETHCDGVAVGRAALGNPWIFAQIKAAIIGKPALLPNKEEICAMAARQAREAEQAFGRNGIIALRKQIAYYLKGVRGAARLRQEVNCAESAREIEKILEKS